MSASSGQLLSSTYSGDCHLVPQFFWNHPWKQSNLSKKSKSYHICYVHTIFTPCPPPWTIESPTTIHRLVWQLLRKVAARGHWEALRCVCAGMPGAQNPKKGRAGRGWQVWSMYIHKKYIMNIVRIVCIVDIRPYVYIYIYTVCILYIYRIHTCIYLYTGFIYIY